MNWPNKAAQRATLWIAVMIGALLVLNLLAGCAPTIRPKVPAAAQASWDGTDQNSGFVGFDQAGAGILTSHARDRYNSLCDRYGGYFHPVVRAGDGISPTPTNTFLIDPQHLVYFATMNRWGKEGKAAAPK